jgi:hypothetical protein
MRSIAYSAKKRGLGFEQVLREKITDFLYGRSDVIKKQIIDSVGYNNVIDTENKIFNTYKDLRNSIFKRTV